MEHAGLAAQEQVRIYDADGKFYGIYCYHEDERLFRPVKMFLEI
jgi:hypothetical protein